MSVRVLIASERAATREKIRAALEPAVDCAEADGPGAAIELATTERFDICFVDARLRGSGIETAGRIRALQPETLLVVLTPVEEETEFFEALRAGAIGYINEGIDPARLPSVVQGLVSGEAAVPRRLVGALIEEMRVRDRRRDSVERKLGDVGLTPREWHVLELLGQGYTTKQIASALHISEVTVRRHVSVLLRKLGVPDRRAAVELLRSANGAH
jgi:DNA-binding NarL/FixJ family response regulator